MTAPTAPTVEVIPIGRITVVNSRARNRRIFKEIVANITRLGLKRPITVTRRGQGEAVRYELVCGEGRLEALRALGQREVPALVIEAELEDCLVMSLVENCARRQHRAIDLLRDIERLKRDGYSDVEIASKTDLSQDYVRDVARLIERGEQRLLRAVESGQIPVSMAVEIAEADDFGVQRALRQAYEKNVLRGRKLIAAKRIVEQRRRQGKGLTTRRGKSEPAVSSAALLRAYYQDSDRKRHLVRKADAARSRVLFVTEALRSLFADEHFTTLLRAEGLDTLPRPLAQRLQTRAEG